MRRNSGEVTKKPFLAHKSYHLWMAKIWPGGQKTARRAAKRPPTGKLKLSRVTSGYGGLKIPLGRIHLTPKNGGYMGENGDFRAGGHWEKLRSSETKRATTDRLVPKRPQFRWLRSRTFWFLRRGPQKGLFGPFLGPRGPGVNFFPNIGKWGIQSGATICPDHTALFRSI